MAISSEKKKTLTNNRSEIKEARVIANYGDPGLDEDYHFDILSRYVIVMMESVDRIPTIDKWISLFAVVQRPQHLWVNVEGGLTGDPTTQQRSDALGNVNVGLSSNFSINGISRINVPYALGETIKIKKLPESLTPSNDSMFTSAFSNWDTSTNLYAGWHTQGSSLQYFSNNPNVAALQYKTIQPQTAGANVYNMFLSKYQYEAFSLNNNISNPTLVANLTSIFTGSWAGASQVYSANGGYLFLNLQSILMSMCEYVDINAGNKQRIASNDCLPLIVTTPNSFPTPKSRQAGTIQYNPTYTTIATSP